MEALLVKDNVWGYVSGIITRLTSDTIATWEEGDRKTKSDLIMSISGPKLKLVRGCHTSCEIWLKLQEVYSFKGPARKTILLKHLMLYQRKEKMCANIRLEKIIKRS